MQLKSVLSAARVPLTAVALVGSLALAAGPAAAIQSEGLIFEDGTNLWQGNTTPDLRGLDGSGPNGTENLESVIEQNSALFGQDVDFVGRVNWVEDDDDSAFEQESDTQGFSLIADLTVTCTANKDGDPEECISFDWAVDFSDLALDWEIVKIGIKAGQSSGFWALDPFVPFDEATRIASGSFGCDSFVELFGLSSCSDIGNNPAISHIDFFGTQTGGDDVPEPASLGLLGIGLLGLGVAARRRRQVA